MFQLWINKNQEDALFSTKAFSLNHILMLQTTVCIILRAGLVPMRNTNCVTRIIKSSRKKQDYYHIIKKLCFCIIRGDFYDREIVMQVDLV